MTGNEFRALRKHLGLGVVAFGRWLGYQGNDNTVAKTVRGYEKRRSRDIPETVAERISKIKYLMIRRRTVDDGGNHD